MSSTCFEHEGSSSERRFMYSYGVLWCVVDCVYTVMVCCVYMHRYMQYCRYNGVFIHTLLYLQNTLISTENIPTEHNLVPTEHTLIPTEHTYTYRIHISTEHIPTEHNLVPTEHTLTPTEHIPTEHTYTYRTLYLIPTEHTLIPTILPIPLHVQHNTTQHNTP
jgi:hypothetical protein